MIAIMRVGEIVMQWKVILCYAVTALAAVLGALAGLVTGDYGDVWKLAAAAALAFFIEMGWRVSIWLRKQMERL